MWNRLQTAANTTTTTLIQTPAELLPRHNNKNNKRHRRRQRRFFDLDSDSDEAPPPDLDQDRKFWQATFDSRLNDVAAESNGPYRYEIYRGKTVPSPSHTPLSGSRDHLPALSSDVNAQAQPQINPHRRRFQSESGWRPTNDRDDNLPQAKHARHESEAPHTISRSIATPSPLGKMYTYGRRNTDAQGVSPPSSPEMNSAQLRHWDHDVSPMEDDEDMAQQRMLAGGPRPPQGPAGPVAPRQTPSKIPSPQAHGRHASGQHPKTSIPMMRRERRKQQDAAPVAGAKPCRPNQQPQGRETPPITSSASFPNNSMGWQDPAGGRLTPTFGAPMDEGPRYGISTTITSANSHQSRTPSPSIGHRLRQLGRSKPEPIESRPAWNGASGRQTLVDPVSDNKNVAPLAIPPKSSRRAERTKDTQARSGQPTNSRDAETSHGSSAAAAVRKIMPSRSGQTPEPRGQALADTGSATNSAAQSARAYPSPPAQSPPASQSQITAPRSQNTPAVPHLSVPDPERAIKRKPPPPSQAPAPSHAVHPSTSSSIYSTQPGAQGLGASPFPATMTSPNPRAPDDNWVQPSSRFSITTYATSAAGSPRPSDEEDRPPVPEVPPVVSMMDRKRPPLRGNDVPHSSEDEPLVISLKSAYVSNPSTGLGLDKMQPRGDTDLSRNGRSTSISSTSKALPPAPPEMVESKDRVVVLNAKLSSLAHRRNNITKSIKQMTELMPPDRLLASAEVLRRREDEKKKVEKLREELAEIQQQEYDLGLKLHRAYKRQDRDAEYESGTLWVRRVTG